MLTALARDFSRPNLIHLVGSRCCGKATYSLTQIHPGLSKSASQGPRVLGARPLEHDCSVHPLLITCRLARRESFPIPEYFLSLLDRILLQLIQCLSHSKELKHLRHSRSRLRPIHIEPAPILPLVVSLRLVTTSVLVIPSKTTHLQQTDQPLRRKLASPKIQHHASESQARNGNPETSRRT